MLKRWTQFINEIFPVFPNVLGGIIGFVSVYMFSVYALELGLFHWTQLVFGSLSYLGFLLCLRVFDELKDEEVDRKIFPDRPLVKGIVSRKDLKFLAGFTLTSILLINFYFWRMSEPFWASVACVVVIYLIYKWFYFPNLMKKNLPLALVTHNPIVYLMNFYILSFFIGSNGQISSMFFWVLICFATPGTAWEISRKIKRPSEENDYTTYSKIWGYKTAGAVTVLLVLISLGLLGNIVISQLNQSNYLALSVLVLPLIAVFSLVYQYLQLSKLLARGIKMRLAVEHYMVALTLSALFYSQFLALK